jgi:hypothetical protein
MCNLGNSFHLFFFFLFCGTGQVLHHLSYTPTPFLLQLFFKYGPEFCSGLALNHNSPTYTSCIVEIIVMHHHAWLISSFELQVSTYMKYSYWVSSSLWSLPASTFYARKDKTLILKMNTYFSILW